MKTEYSDGFFNCSGKHGFLPISEPLKKLPDDFEVLQMILDNMSIHQPDGTIGTLGVEGAIVGIVKGMPNYLDFIKKL